MVSTQTNRGTAALLSIVALVAAGTIDAIRPTETASASDSAESATVCFTSAPSPKDIPVMLAVQSLEAQGWTIERRDFEDVALLARSAMSGDCDVAVNAAFQSVLAANEGGADLRILALTTGNEWSLVADPAIEGVDQLGGKRVGTFSEASYDRAMIQVAVDNAGVTPQWIYGGGSGTRVQAMLDGQLDATGADATDIVTLSQNPEARVNVLTNFSTEIPQLMTNVAFASVPTLESRADFIAALIGAMQDSYASVHEDDGQSAHDEASSIVPTIEAGLLDKLVDKYVDDGLWPLDPVAAIDPAAAQFSAEFYQKAGQFEDVPDSSTYLADMTNITR